MKEVAPMKVTAFIGSARKQHTYNASEKFLQKLRSLGDIEYEIVMLSDCNLEICKGCLLCFDKGEEFCPLKDDRDKLIAKISNSDGVIFASPNYAFQVSALMKIFLDRLAFFFHRPRFFAKTFTSIVTQGMLGGEDIVRYLDSIGSGLGFKVVKGCCLTTLEPMTEKAQKRNERIIDKHSQRFYSKLIQKEYPTPSIFMLMMFKIARWRIKILQNENFRDYKYYLENGWFESDYFYPVKLSPFKKSIGKFFDLMATQMAKNNRSMVTI